MPEGATPGRKPGVSEKNVGARKPGREMEMAGKLEEALLSIKDVLWDLSTPASVIVEKVREQDLSLIQSLEARCREQLVPVAFKLGRGLKVVPLVALLLVGRSSVLNSVVKKADSAVNVSTKKPEGGLSLVTKKVDTVVNVVSKQGDLFGNTLAKKVETTGINTVVKKVDGCDDSPGGTLVDLVLGMALAHSSSCAFNKPGEKLSKCKPYVKEEGGDFWQGEGSSLYRKTSNEFDASVGYDLKFNRLDDWDSGSSDSNHLKDFSKWDESFSGLKSRRDSGEWEEVPSKNRKKSAPLSLPDSKDLVDYKLRKTLSGGGDVERPAYARSLDDKSSTMGEDIEYSCEIARKLLECLLLFSPRLSAHAQSPLLPPLLRAAQANDEALVSLLLEARAPVNEKDADGNTALHWALRQATPVNRRTVNTRVVRGLLNAGANVMTGNKLGATPVHTAAGHGHFEALSCILEKDSSGVNVMAATKETPLHYAVKNNHIACTFLLLKHGANRNVASLRNQKPLQLAPSVEMKALLLHDDIVIKENTWDSFKPILVHASSPSSPLYSLAMQSQSQFPSIADASSIGFMSSMHFQSQQSVELMKSVGSGGSMHGRVDGPCFVTDSHKDGSFDWLASQTLSINSRDLGGDMDGYSQKDSVNLPQYKTVMCRFFTSNEGCGWANKCHFAHSEEELIGADRIDGLDLRAGGSQSDDGSDQSAKNFKTKLCTHHEKTGKCPHGTKCTFAHGMIELRGALSAAISIRPPVRIDTHLSTANSLGSSGSSEKGDEYMSARKVFVGGLPHFIQSEELWEFFEGEFGKVMDAVVICGIDADGKARSRGFGFVVFQEPKHADVAVRRHYLPFRGKKVEVKRAMARVDYGDEPSKLNSPTFPSGGPSSLPSGQMSRSPTIAPSSPIVDMAKDISSMSLAVPQQAWSLPPLTVDSLKNPSQDGVQLPPNTSALFPEHRSSSQLSTYSSISSGSDLNGHLVSQHSAPSPVNGLGSGSFTHQNSGSQFSNFGSLFPQSNSRSLDSGLERGSSFSEAGVGFSSLHAFNSSSNTSSNHHPLPMNGTSISYSNGGSFDSIAPRPHNHEFEHRSQSFFSSTPGPSPYPYGNTQQPPPNEEEEFSELLAMLQG